jgi:hypothetical protein
MNLKIKSRQMSLRRIVSRLRGDTSGLALVEFAFGFPILMTIAGFGMEITNLAVANQKISQMTLALADNMSRVGETSSLTTTQLRESDVNDAFIGATKQVPGLDVTTRGRIILSSLEQNPANSNSQWIHWQRCIGTKNVGSSYGVQGAGATGTAFTGMGTASARITAPDDAPVMFVEVKYDYKPLFGSLYVGAKTLEYEASFIVRDDRDRTGAGIFNPTPAATSKTCNLFTAT